MEQATRAVPVWAPDTRGGSRGVEGNRFLAAMAAADLAQVLPLLEPIELRIGATLQPAGQPRTTVLFVDEGVTSVLARFEDGKRAEVATIGREGLLGFVGLHGPASAPFSVIVQVPGRGRWFPTAGLGTVARHSPALRELLARYAHAQLIQVAQTAACNAVHAVEQRAARWLLMTQDRMGMGFELTQEYLAIMLGVRRPTVNAIAQSLQESGAIRYSRGAVVVRDRALLERFACPCYAIVRAAYEHAVPGCFT